MRAPQIILIVLMTLGLGMSIADHGRPKTGKTSATAALIANIILFGLLYWGGFWK